MNPAVQGLSIFDRAYLIQPKQHHAWELSGEPRGEVELSDNDKRGKERWSGPSHMRRSINTWSCDSWHNRMIQDSLLLTSSIQLLSYATLCNLTTLSTALSLPGAFSTRPASQYTPDSATILKPHNPSRSFLCKRQAPRVPKMLYLQCIDTLLHHLEIAKEKCVDDTRAKDRNAETCNEDVSRHSMSIGGRCSVPLYAPNSKILILGRSAWPDPAESRAFW